MIEVMQSAMCIPAQGMSAVPMPRTRPNIVKIIRPQHPLYINPAIRNPQQPIAAGQPMPAPPVEASTLHLCNICACQKQSVCNFGSYSNMDMKKRMITLE